MPHAFIPVPNTALVELVFSYQGQIVENTFHVTKGSPFSATDLQGLTSTFDTWHNAVSTGYKNVLLTACALTTIKARALDTSSSPIYIFSLVTARGGVLSGSINLPPSVTKCITLQTGLAGRSYRGRIYIPGIQSSDLQASPNTGLILTTRVASYVTSLNALIAQINAISGYHLTVVSLRNGGAWRAVGVATTILNAAFASYAVDSQRRRLPGRGH